MISVHIEKIKNVQNDFQMDIENQRTMALNKLKEFKRISRIKLSSDEKDYLSKVINLLDEKDILFSTPNEIMKFKTSLGTVPLNSRPKGKKTLKQIIIDILAYKELRETFYPEYFYQIGIKSCVYCNALLTISTKKKNPRSIKHKANFDVDHYHSKDEFPFLSIFLFNLYPACAPCNRKKSKSSKIKFDLYSNEPIKVSRSEFKFELDKGSMAKFLITKKKEDLHFRFDSGASGFQETFGIQQIYETQKDLIEELIIKKHMYDKDNCQSLQNSFSKLNLHPDLYLRTLVGNYIKEQDIHRRPLSKFTQDIARALGIIN